MNFLRSTWWLICFALAGCGGAAAHVHEVTDYPDGRRLTVDYWIAAGHLLTNPDLSEVRTPQWTITGFHSQVDDAAVEKITEGVVRAITKTIVPIP